MTPAPGMSDLNHEQSMLNERIFGHRYLTIQQRPEIPNRKTRRAQKRATRKR